MKADGFEKRKKLKKYIVILNVVKDLFYKRHHHVPYQNSAK